MHPMTYQAVPPLAHGHPGAVVPHQNSRAVCQWSHTASGTCGQSIATNVPGINQHLRQCHNVGQDYRGAMARCRWGHCDVEVDVGSLAKHIAHHLRPKSDTTKARKRAKGEEQDVCLLSENDVLEYMGKRAAPHLLTGNSLLGSCGRGESAMHSTTGCENHSSLEANLETNGTYSTRKIGLEDAYYHRQKISSTPAHQYPAVYGSGILGLLRLRHELLPVQD
ncbi:hypothetical protein FOMPIDRAFT_112875 [Fomitopsis schrenkii]|uniref:Uncharacterized protein n=1 Tax=Fomitopsis schrenkii TaxID=2126942 RepID=S8DTB9_FOMSC|nr:hypothetical protein FOMPIDRAFT_112875 [Fomitopsis schrenkii]